MIPWGGEEMALEVYYPQDIRNALLAAEQANNAALMASCGGSNESCLERGEFAQGYEAGYRAALTTMALAFGLLRSGESHWERRERQESHTWQPTSLPASRRRNGKNG